jgi:hypothetical protein
MCEKYPMVFDIIWALSFNHDIQQQLRSNKELMSTLTHLQHDLNNAQMRKTTWNIMEFTIRS